MDAAKKALAKDVQAEIKAEADKEAAEDKAKADQEAAKYEPKFKPVTVTPQIIVSFVAAGVVQEVTVDLSDGKTSAADIFAKLAADGIDISAVTNVDVPKGNGNDPAASAKLLADTTARINELATASGIEPPAVQQALVPDEEVK